MRILVHDYAGHVFQVQLSRQLAARGHEVLHVYCSSTQTPRGAMTVRPADPAGFSVEPIDLGGMIPKTGYVRRLRMEAAYGKRLVAVCRRFQPDVVLSANTPSIPQWRLVRECRKQQIRHVFWVQDVYGLATYKLLKRRLPGLGHVAGLFFLWLDRRSARLSDALVVITEDFQPMFEQWGIDRSRIHVVHNWSVLEELPAGPRDNVWSQANRLTSGPRFLYSGTLAMKHNPVLLLEVAKLLDQRDAGELIVVSEGAGVEWLEREATAAGLRSLRSFPFQPFEQLADVLASADVLVAILEPDAGAFSVPSKILSYMCAGRPVLGAMPKQNLAARLITDQGAGRVVAPDDVDGLRQAAIEMLDSPEGRSQWGAAARRYAEQNFDIGQIADRFERILSAD